MGLNKDIVDSIFQEHAFRPIDGEVLLIGRQTIYMTPAEVLEMMREHGLKPRRAFDEDTMINKSTVNRRLDFEGMTLISDVGLFQLLGAKRVRALDHSNYEGAEIIHDLT